MNKWQIAGNDAFYRITKTDFATKETESFNADHPMKFGQALGFIAEKGDLGDIIFCPNGTVLSVANRIASA